MKLAPELHERRRKIRMHERELKELKDTCPHVFVEVKREPIYRFYSKPRERCEICSDEQDKFVGQDCAKSPDKICHFLTTVDRDGIPCVELMDKSLDHNFPRENLDKELGCVYCTRPMEKGVKQYGF